MKLFFFFLSVLIPIVFLNTKKHKHKYQHQHKHKLKIVINGRMKQQQEQTMSANNCFCQNYCRLNKAVLCNVFRIKEHQEECQPQVYADMFPPDIQVSIGKIKKHSQYLERSLINTEPTDKQFILNYSGQSMQSYNMDEYLFVSQKYNELFLFNLCERCCMARYPWHLGSLDRKDMLTDKFQKPQYQYNYCVGRNGNIIIERTAELDPMFNRIQSKPDDFHCKNIKGFYDVDLIIQQE